MKRNTSRPLYDPGLAVLLLIFLLYRSFWTLTGSPSLLRHPELQALARDKGCTPAQALYRFSQSQGITPLTGTTSEEHMKEDLRVDKIDLTTSEVQTLVHFIWT